MTSLTQNLTNIMGDAFEAQGLPPELGVVRVSDRPDLCQFQCNGAMAAAKAAQKNPRDVAQGIVERLRFVKNPRPEDIIPSMKILEGSPDVFSKVEIAGPGFINLDVTLDYLTDYLKNLQNFGVVPVTNAPVTILDYGGPNIAKPMHVGHLRAAIIGDSLRRMMKFSGYKTLGDVHLGDWGTHMGMLIGDYMACGEQDLVLNADISNPVDVARLMEDFAVRYPKASAAAKEDETLMARAREVTAKLQNKEEPYYSIWQKVRKVSVEGMKETYGLLNVEFDLWKGEADVHDYIEPMVADLKAKNLAFLDDGALIMAVAGNDDKKEIPPIILLKSDGAALYSTTDMATIVERVKLYSPDKIVYVVDQRQSLHFDQVFRAVRKGGIVGADTEMTFAGFGTMNGQDGKPFKTRAGGVMRLDDLMAMGIEKAMQRLNEANLAKDIDNAELQDIAKKVAIAAIKFADLQNQRQSDYIFDLDKLTSFEGKTGPYLLYQAVRIKSLLRKAKEQGIAFDAAAIHIQEQDRDLALLLGQFSDALAISIHHYAPHYLCDYMYRLAQTFSSYYANCHILSEVDEALRASRLKLCQKTYDQLEQALSLLGIFIPERM